MCQRNLLHLHGSFVITKNTTTPNNTDEEGTWFLSNVRSTSTTLRRFTFQKAVIFSHRPHIFVPSATHSDYLTSLQKPQTYHSLNFRSATRCMPPTEYRLWNLKAEASGGAKCHCCMCGPLRGREISILDLGPALKPQNSSLLQL